MTAEPKESAEPRTEALSAEEVRFVRKHRNVGYVATLPDAVRLIDSLLATLDAATELPWHRWPTPEVYRFDRSRPGWADAEAAAIADHNHRVRAARGLEEWTEAELRAAWGDR